MCVSYNEDSKQYAAILIPTLCRYEHLLRCIDSLKHSKCAIYTDVYIGLDYPSKSSHREGYKEIKKYLDDGIRGFANVYIYEHDHNIGGTDNLAYIRAEASKTHNKFIYAEDDNEFSPNYLEYMNELLDMYEKDDSVFAISGYNYPMTPRSLDGTVYTNDIYFAAFGSGFWTEKYKKMEGYLTNDRVDTIYCSIPLMRKLMKKAPNQFCNFVRGRLGYMSTIYHNGQIWKVDLMMGIYMYATEKKMVYPIIPKVKNWGFDGSGENCSTIVYNENKKATHRNMAINNQLLDDNRMVEDIIMVNNEGNIYLNSLVNDFFEISHNELFRSKLAYYMSVLLGTDVVSRMINRK